MHNKISIVMKKTAYISRGRVICVTYTFGAYTDIKTKT